MQEKHSSIKLDLLMGGALTLVGVLIRIPYLALIPEFFDEIMQTVYALNIQPGKFMPPVGNDAYVGPLFSYLIAVCLRIFGASPVAPRIIALLMGALTVGLTYLLARVLGLRWPWAALAGSFIAANPHHILVNSHYAGSTYMVPLFGTAFLLAMALAVKRGSGFWLIAAGALFGLALQANPISALVLPGVIIWFLLQRKPRIGLRTPWPYLAVAATILAYAPVVIYNVQNGLVSMSVLSENRTYVWQPTLSLQAYAHNLWRLLLQLGHQVSGVMEEQESFRALLGLPLLYSAWAVAGLIYALLAKQDIRLAALAVGSQVIIMPWLTDHYGLIVATRFTNQLTPLFCVAMGALAAGVWEKAMTLALRFARCSAGASVNREAERTRDASLDHFRLPKPTAWLVGALFVAISLWPLVSLFRYYDRTVASGQTNAPFFAFFDEFMRRWHGERVLVSDSLASFNVPEYFLSTRRVSYTLLPIGRMMERLATDQEIGRVIILLSSDDLSRASPQVNLTDWVRPDMPAGRKLDFGAYLIADARQVRKPTFVLPDGVPLAATVRAVQANFADQLSVIGYEPKAKLAPGERFIVNLYWKAIGAIPESYTGFLHLIGPDGRLVAQDDHELGRGFYRTLVWQTDEVVRERYEWVIPKDLPNGDYTLRVGVYPFPSLKRLSVRSTNTSAQDDLVLLDTLHVGP
jgi:4-amino-4-deoxy-L-arabinose transferase-like glycosyltransferase